MGIVWQRKCIIENGSPYCYSGIGHESSVGKVGSP
jgi:hypothetical protein